MKKEVTLTSDQFKEISTDVAAEMCVEAEEHGVKGIAVAMLTALFCSKLHTALFDEEKLEVE